MWRIIICTHTHTDTHTQTHTHRHTHTHTHTHTPPHLLVSAAWADKSRPDNISCVDPDSNTSHAGVLVLLNVSFIIIIIIFSLTLSSPLVSFDLFCGTSSTGKLRPRGGQDSVSTGRWECQLSVTVEIISRAQRKTSSSMWCCSDPELRRRHVCLQPPDTLNNKHQQKTQTLWILRYFLLSNEIRPLIWKSEAVRSYP